MKTFGLYDYRDKCWMGNDKGPNTYTDKMLARAAATILTEQFGRLIGAKVIPPDINKLKDEVTPPVSFEKAWKKLGLD
jgi:hypothetical protein